MKTNIKEIILFTMVTIVLPLTITYLLFSFIIADLNCFNWKLEARILMVLVSFFTLSLIFKFAESLIKQLK